MTRPHSNDLRRQVVRAAGEGDCTPANEAQADLTAPYPNPTYALEANNAVR